MGLLIFIGYVFLLLFIFVSGVFIFFLVVGADDLFEKILRFLAAGLGFFIFFAAKASGISVPELVLMSSGNASSVIGLIVSFIAPMFIGGICTYFIFINIGVIEYSNNKAVYFIVSFLTLIVFVFIDTFISSIFGEGGTRGILPNALFVIGVLISLLFNPSVVRSIRSLISVGDVLEGETSEGKKAPDWTDKL